MPSLQLQLPAETLREIQLEASRQDRAQSWLIQQAWRLARERIRQMPSPKDRRGAVGGRRDAAANER